MGFSDFHELLAAHYNLSFLPELNEHRLLRNYLKLEACELSVIDIIISHEPANLAQLFEQFRVLLHQVFQKLVYR